MIDVSSYRMENKQLPFFKIIYEITYYNYVVISVGLRVRLNYVAFSAGLHFWLNYYVLPPVWAYISG